jgi:nucleolar protein 16
VDDNHHHQFPQVRARYDDDHDENDKINMARPLQRRKNRSSVPKKRQKQKSKKQLLNNPIIAANWNSEETPVQNYRRLGLVSRLNKSTGGKERTVSALTNNTSDAALLDDPLAINPAEQAQKPTTTEVAIERDPETGAIVGVLDSSPPNPLNDLLNELGEVEPIDFNAIGRSVGRLPKMDSSHGVNTDVTRQLEEFAASGVRKAPRGQSEREEEWVARLVEKHGDDYKAMFWDKQLNVLQQSEGDLKRRVKKWKAKQR